MREKRRSWMMNLYLVKLAGRLVIFSGVSVLYLRHRELIGMYMHAPVKEGINPLQLLWLVFMVMMLLHLFPTGLHSMAVKRMKARYYVPAGYDGRNLALFRKDQNLRAFWVMLIWLAFNSVFGVLYFSGILEDADLFMLTTLYFICDYICILFFCPFQTFILKNRCCISCRIYDWGHFMMFTPMAFIRSFYSLSLFVMSLIVLLHWEIGYASHPERFWSGSNKAIQCDSCRDRTCRIKKKLKGLE